MVTESVSVVTRYIISVFFRRRKGGGLLDP